MESFHCRGTIVTIKEGDLTEEVGDAIVVPANSFNHMRGGVAGVVRQRGGDIIEEEAMGKAPVPVGKAVITTGGNLSVKYVIHAPTMKLPVQRTTPLAVRKAVRAALFCADEHNLKRMSFPGMGTGTGWVAYSDAALAMLGEIKNYLESVQGGLAMVTIVAYSSKFYRILLEVARQLFTGRAEKN